MVIHIEPDRLLNFINYFVMIAGTAIVFFFAAYFFILAACDAGNFRGAILSMSGLLAVVFTAGYLLCLVLTFVESAKSGVIAIGISIGILIVALIFYKYKDVPPPSDEWLQ